MNEAQTVNFETLHVKRKTGFTQGFGRIVAVTLGIFGMLVGAALFVTIIGIIPGFFVMLGGLGFFALAVGKQDVKCPHCKKRQTVLQRAEDFECARCKNTVVLDWE
jgi:hypothetical protein